MGERSTTGSEFFVLVFFFRQIGSEPLCHHQEDLFHVLRDELSEQHDHGAGEKEEHPADDCGWAEESISVHSHEPDGDGQQAQQGHLGPISTGTISESTP